MEINQNNPHLHFKSSLCEGAKGVRMGMVWGWDGSHGHLSLTKAANQPIPTADQTAEQTNTHEAIPIVYLYSNIEPLRMLTVLTLNS